MSNFNIVKESTVDESFRVKSIIGRFDLDNSGTTTETFTGSIDLPDHWNVGVIVGNSGSGKTTIANHLFSKELITKFKWSKNAVVDDMPSKIEVQQITKTFNSVGFSSPPSWIKPYHVLSNGEKMRVDLARAMLSDKEMFVFDEFTSVVDRTVARVGSMAIQKAVRRQDRKFIAVTCHFDVIKWLQPDWVFDTNTMTFSLREKKSPDYRSKFSIVQTKLSGTFLKNITI